ncbi:MAG: LysE family translocator, partial [Paracoccaceae bacterium]
LVVVFSPGAAAIAIASQGAGNGVRRAFFGVIGIASANAVYFVLSATGIAGLLIASNLVFTVIKWVGVAYLIYLGLMAIFSKSGGIVVTAAAREKSARSLFMQGLVIEFANPKALLYFAAILPQFLDVTQPIVPQILLMGFTTVFIDLSSYTAYACLGSRLSRGGIKKSVVNGVNKLAGAALIFAGIKMASVSTAR